VEKRFHAELDSVLGGRAPTAEDLERLPYTSAIVKETLRLYPPSWWFGRVTTTEFELGGQLLPPGARLLASSWVIHRKPELYQDPAAFRPERWLDGSTENLPKYSFMPFGGGQRKCIGANFSQTEIAMVLASLGRRWRMRLSRGTFEVEALFTVQPVDGMPATVHLRDGNGASPARSPARQQSGEPENDRLYWDEVAPIWNSGGGQRLWRTHSDAVNSDLVARWLPDDVTTILKTDLWDEAMGDGIYPRLSSNGAKVSAVDVSEEIVAAAARRHPGIEAHRADLRSLPFPDGEFDAVCSNSSLDHFTTHMDILVSLSELRRVMRPGGTLVLTLDNPANPIVGLVKLLPRDWLNALWLRWGRASRRLGLLPYYVGATYGRSRLRGVLERNGFAVEETTAVVHAPRPLAVVAGKILERRATAETQRRFLRQLRSMERLCGSPTRYVTGNFVAVRARRL
jgi:SAM-dependent methyltransferase